MNLFDIRKDSKRNSNRTKLGVRAKELMCDDDGLCGDDTHRLTQIMFYEKFGINVTIDEIKFICSMDRVRRKVFKDSPELDKREYTKKRLGKEDMEYFAR